MQEETINLNYWKYLEKHRWKLIQLNGRLFEGGDVSVNFTLAEMKFSGTFGPSCLTGKFDSKGEKISFSSVDRISEEKDTDVDEATAKLASEFFKNLNENNLAFDVADQTLNIYKDGKIILMFGRAS